MNFIKFVHTADVHIKISGDEGFNALREILEKSKQIGAKALFISGDLFDSDKSAFETRTDIRTLFESYPAIKIFMTSGNHDWESYSKNVNYGSNAVVLSEKPFEKSEAIEGFSVYGIPFQKGGDISSVLKIISQKSKDESQFPILLTHGTLIDQWLNDILVYLSQYEKENDSFYIHEEALKGCGLPLILLGHYHNFVERNYENTKAAYCGSPIATSTKNSGRRRASLIQIDAQKQKLQLSEILLSSAFNISTTIKVTPGKEDDIFRQIEEFTAKESDKNASLDLRIEGFTAVGENEFQKRLNDAEKKIRDKFKDISLKNNTRELISLRANPLAKKFLEIWEEEFKRLEKSSKQRDAYYKALEFAFIAFEESLIKKQS